MKKRIMFCGEASFLATGFSTYARELLSRLHASGKYELLEYASYGNHDDERAGGLPWAYASASYDPSVPGEREAYDANHALHFGSAKFERTCLEFRPDVVADVRDHWMLEHESRSPFRRHYRWAIMPTVDAEPQDDQWLETYAGADAVFGYSDWGADLLRQQGRGRINVLGSAPPCADLNVFRPDPDRDARRQAHGIGPDDLVLGTVMRNQKRKLYPELIEAFAAYLKSAPAGLAGRTWLYLHTAWPDVGWDLPRFLRESGVGSRVLFTYICQRCSASFSSTFHDAICSCRACGHNTAVFPATNMALDREGLAQVMGLFDVYVQYANSEGFGMPQVEAAACGVPVMATDYSAMSDVVRKVNGIPIRPLCLVREHETHCKRAVPDQNDFVAKLTSFLLKPASVRAGLARAARRGVEENYGWDATAKKWTDCLDALPPAVPWDAPRRRHAPDLNVPDGLSESEFVRWGMCNVAGLPHLANSHVGLRMARDLTWGATYSHAETYGSDMSVPGNHQKARRFGRDQAVEHMLRLAEWHDQWEATRAGHA